jgi:peptidoglycan/LPS O-acetylase OafA/YrhL
MTRIPSLDGLRALDLSRRRTTHHPALQFDPSCRPHLVCHLCGGTGVYIFFVISGYLITGLLLNEHQKRGSISMRGFYLRRAMRILPPLYTYVAVLLLLGWAGRLALNRLDILSALFFFHDYASATMWSLEHFWFLSIEEQFYFLWPLILFYCLSKPGIAGRLTASRIALAVILISPVIRVLSFRLNIPYLHNGYGFHMRADALMYGCVFALLQGTPMFERVYAVATRIWWIPPAVIFVSDCIGARYTNYWQLPFGYTI